MENYIIIMIDGFGFAFFLIALFFGLSNYKEFTGSRALWVLFCMTMFVGSLMALAVGLEWMEFYPLVADPIEDALALSFAVLLFAFALVEKENGNIR